MTLFNLQNREIPKVLLAVSTSNNKGKNTTPRKPAASTSTSEMNMEFILTEEEEVKEMTFTPTPHNTEQEIKARKTPTGFESDKEEYPNSQPKIQKPTD